MGTTSIYKSFYCTGIFCTATLLNSLLGETEANDKQPGLAESFNAGAPQVDPVVVGRERWNQKPENQVIPEQSSEQAKPANKETQTSDIPSPISELDPLETQQIKPPKDDLNLSPPKNLPATKIVRNFDGTLVFKPRKLGFAYDFPYQLENSRGKRLAFVDMTHLKSVDPQDFVGKIINVMGKLEPTEEGSDDLVIRARILRVSN